jgi:hypothetical protein
MNILPCIEHQTGKTLKAICSDNALEFCSGIFPAKLKQLGISQEFTLHYEHEQAGIAENTNRTIMDKVRTMLHASAMNESFWPHAFYTAIFVTNRSWHYGVGGIPYEKFTGRIHTAF